MKNLRLLFFNVIGMTFIVFFTVRAHAASSELFFNNVSGLGNAYSGEAVLAEDASAAYFNPAGLSLIDHPQLVLGDIEGRFDGQFNGTDIFSLPPLNIQNTGVTHGQAVIAPYPFFYYSRPITPKVTFGIGLSTPYGIGVAIPETSLVRYAGTRFIMYVIDFSPVVAYKINDKFSAGFGFDMQRLTYLTRVMFPSFTGGPDAKIINTTGDRLNGWGYGWHAGLLYQIKPSLRVGLTYHSQAVFQSRGGQSQYVFTPGNNVDNEIISNNFRFTTTLPPTTTISAMQVINPQWELLGTINYSQWHMVKQTIFKNIASPSATGAPTQVNGVLLQNYFDTWRFALGTNYKINSKCTLRVGVSYESDNTNVAYRPLTDPGTAATSIAVGAHYQMKKTLGFDVGYLHAFVQPSNINTISGFNIEVGRDKLQRDAAGIQATWDFV